MSTTISKKAIGLGVAVLVAAVSLGACTGSRTATTAGEAPVITPTSTTAATTPSDATPQGDATPTVTGRLSADEIDAIVLMREEEKLAHDVYATLGELWGLRIFENIAAAETTHTEAVAYLIDQYDLEDPAVGNDVGEFTNPDFAALYEDLVERGSESITAALAVGAFIEDVDIADLRLLLGVIESPSVTSVFEMLSKGSRNHLRAFTSQLESRGEVYTPEFLTQAEFDAIVESPRERGRD